MKLRAGAPALLLSFLLPAALTEVGLHAVPLSEPQSFAQASDPVTEVARQRYEDGVKAYDAGRYEDARAAFLQAYALKRHPAVLLNLGQSELRSNHPEDAGNHLTQFLREHKSASPDQRAAAEKGISEAKKKTGFIIVIADANGADLSIDGASVGKSPLLDPIFVKPGKHTVFATYQGKSATTQVDAKAGTAAAATVTLGVAGAAPAPVPVAPAPVPATPAPATPPPAAPAAPPVSPAPAAPPPGPAPSYPPSDGVGFSLGSNMGTMGPDQATGGREPFFHWYKRKPLAWVGTGVTALGLGFMIGGFASAASASSSVDNITEQINDYAAANPSTVPAGRQGKYCGPRDDPSGDLPGYENACGELRSALDDYDSNPGNAIGGVGVGLFIVGAAGTVTYAVLDWYLKKPAATAEGPHVTAIAPVITPEHAGLGIAGTF